LDPKYPNIARSTPLTTGIRSAPTTEMYTRCRVPARDAARTRFTALSSHLAAGVLQPRDDETSERARAAGDQDRTVSSVLMRLSLLSFVSQLDLVILNDERLTTALESENVEIVPRAPTYQ
jgi:hypothetical protein